MPRISWANLPPDVLYSISEFLKNDIELLRFRAVCNSWRRSTDPPQESPELPMLMSFPSDDTADRVIINYMLYQTTIYRLEEPESSFNHGSLLIVNESKAERKLTLLNPFTMSPVENLPDDFPRVLNIINFRVTQLCKRFNLRWLSNSHVADNNNEDAEQPYENDDDDDDEEEDDNEEEHKVELLVDFESENSFYVINEAHLCSVTIDEEVWTLVNSEIEYRDIICYEDSLYGVDRNGVVVAVEIDSHDSLTIPVAEPFLGDWYLAKANRDLFLIGRDYRLCQDQVYFDNNRDNFMKRPGVGNVLVDFKVYILETDEENSSNQQWEELENLGNLVFFVNRSCSYAIDASKFAGCEGNCLIFVDEVTDPFGGGGDDDDDDECDLSDDDDANGPILEGVNVGVYDIDEGFTTPLASCPNFAKIFWPPPAWLRSIPARNV